MSYFRVPSFLNRSRDEAQQQDNRGLVPQYVGGAGAEEDEDFYATGSVVDENSQTLTDAPSVVYDGAAHPTHQAAYPPAQYQANPNYGHVRAFNDIACDASDHNYLFY